MITWMAFKAGLKKFASFMRRYGWILIVGLIMVMAFVGWRTAAGRQVVGTLWNVIDRERKLHNQYVDEVDRIHEEELEARRLASERALNAVRAAEEEYRRRHEQLSERKKRQIKRLVELHGDDEHELTRKLADQFNFKYIP